MANRGAWISTPSSSGNVTIPEGYHNGSGYVNTSNVYNSGYNAGTATLTDGKTKIANAITAKGVTTATDASFEQMVANIEQLATLNCTLIYDGNDYVDTTSCSFTAYSNKIYLIFSWKIPAEQNLYVSGADSVINFVNKKNYWRGVTTVVKAAKVNSTKTISVSAPNGSSDNDYEVTHVTVVEIG